MKIQVIEKKEPALASVSWDWPEAPTKIIFSCLDIKSLARTSLVCRNWCALGRDDKIWEALFLKNLFQEDLSMAVFSWKEKVRTCFVIQQKKPDIELDLDSPDLKIVSFFVLLVFIGCNLTSLALGEKDILLSPKPLIEKIITLGVLNLGQIVLTITDIYKRCKNFSVVNTPDRWYLRMGRAGLGAGGMVYSIILFPTTLKGSFGLLPPSSYLLLKGVLGKDRAARWFRSGLDRFTILCSQASCIFKRCCSR